MRIALIILTSLFFCQLSIEQAFSNDRIVVNVGYKQNYSYLEQPEVINIDNQLHGINANLGINNTKFEYTPKVCILPTLEGIAPYCSSSFPYFLIPPMP